MRATETEQTGGAGVSDVSANLERIGWGPVRNESHDLGTDLLAQVRDDRLFDRGLIVGIQVKAGPSYFKRPKSVDGEVVGWWYVEESADHFDDWVMHALPHLLVLHELDERISYWAHITATSAVSTGKGCKVFVPVSQTIDDENRAALLQVAGTAASVHSIEGTSVSASSQSVSPNRRLRHALLAPRLVTPHRNRGVSEPITAVEAVALVAEGRFADWGFFAEVNAGVPTPEASLHSQDWEWAFAGAVWQWVFEDDTNGVEGSAATARNGPERTACAAVLACAAQKVGAYHVAVELLSNQIERDELAPADHAWMFVQRARARAELGDLVGSRQDAAAAQRALRGDRTDLTVSALASAASWLLYTSLAFGEGDLKEHLAISDTAVAWWRQVRIGDGLRDAHADQFKLWAQLPKPVIGWRRETVDDQLFAAEFSADLTGEHGTWRSVTSLIWQQRLQNGPETEELHAHYADAIEAILLVGDKHTIEAVSNRILLSGPCSAVASVIDAVRVDNLTRSNADATFELLTRCGDLASSDQADRLVHELLGLLYDEPPAAIRASGVNVERRVLEAIGGLLTATSWGVHDRVASSVPTPAMTAQPLLVRPIMRIMAHIDGSALGEETTNYLWGTAAEAQSDVSAAILGCLVGSGHTLAKDELILRSAAGDLDALGALKRYEMLPADAVEELIPRLTAMVIDKLASADVGRYEHGHDIAADLTALNLVVPHLAEWSALSDLLVHPAVSAADKRRASAILFHQFSELPTGVAEQLVESRALVANAKTGGFHGEFGAVDEALAIAAGLRSTPEIEGEIARLSTSSPENRKLAIRILSSGVVPHLLPILGSLIVDVDPSVRHAAASLIGQLSAAEGGPVLQTLVLKIIDNPGVTIPLNFIHAFVDAGGSPRTEVDIADLLAHPSARVRALARRAAGHGARVG